MDVDAGGAWACAHVVLVGLAGLPSAVPLCYGMHRFFCAGQDKPRAGELINVLREANQPVPEELLKFGTAVKKKESKMYGAHFKVRARANDACALPLAGLHLQLLHVCSRTRGLGEGC